MQRASGCGLVYLVSQNRFFLPSILRQFGNLAQNLARQSGNGRVTTAAFLDRSGIGRRLSIEVLEFFDRVKFTRRVGDAREILRPAAEAFIDRQTPADI